jgi:hypothetical protein
MHTLMLALGACLVALAMHTVGGTERRIDPPRDAYVINLARNGRRMQAFQRAYEASDLAGVVALRRVDAVDGHRVDWSKVVSPDALEDLHTMQSRGHRVRHEELTPGAVGCYLSHLEAWRRLQQSGAPYAMVFEDDSVVPSDTLQRALDALKLAPTHWDILLLGYEGHGASTTVTKVPEFLRLHAYIITNRAATGLLGSALPMKRQLDWELRGRINSHGLQVYGVPSHSKITSVWYGTDIQSGVKHVAEGGADDGQGNHRRASGSPTGLPHTQAAELWQ